MPILVSCGICLLSLQPTLSLLSFDTLYSFINNLGHLISFMAYSRLLIYPFEPHSSTFMIFLLFEPYLDFNASYTLFDILFIAISFVSNTFFVGLYLILLSHPIDLSLGHLPSAFDVLASNIPS